MNFFKNLKKRSASTSKAAQSQQSVMKVPSSGFIAANNANFDSNKHQASK